jgi:hypothetical protein
MRDKMDELKSEVRMLVKIAKEKWEKGKDQIYEAETRLGKINSGYYEDVRLALEECLDWIDEV